jgi:hypothetical protein
MYQSAFIGRVRTGSDAKHIYLIPMPRIRKISHDYVPDEAGSIYRGRPERLVPHSQAMIEKLERALAQMKHLDVRLMALRPKRHELEIWLHEHPRYTSHESQWHAIERALTRAYKLPVIEVVRQ